MSLIERKKLQRMDGKEYVNSLHTVLQFSSKDEINMETSYSNVRVIRRISFGPIQVFSGPIRTESGPI
jgi:hypothetical protein